MVFVWTAGRSDRTSLRRIHTLRLLYPIVGTTIGYAIYFLLLQVSHSSINNKHRNAIIAKQFLAIFKTISFNLLNEIRNSFVANISTEQFEWSIVLRFIISTIYHATIEIFLLCFKFNFGPLFLSTNWMRYFILFNLFIFVSLMLLVFHPNELHKQNLLLLVSSIMSSTWPQACMQLFELNSFVI